MGAINIGEKRYWLDNNEVFTVIKDKGINCGSRWFIIEYETDNRKQTLQESVLISESVNLKK